MARTTRSSKVTRTVRVFTLAAVGVGAAACAAVLGIEDRALIDGAPGSEGGSDGATGDGSNDGPSADGPVPVKDGGMDGAPTVRCEPSTCGAAGGSCVGGACTFLCPGTTCNAATRRCPAGSDCTIDCSGANACDSVQCVGGHSCTLLCSGSMSCKGPIACESERCDFQCTAESCKAAPPRCDASICIANCAGDKSCDKGIDFRASTFCGITCSGSPSCNTASLVKCVSPDASINCANAMDTCKDGKPSCFGPPGSFCAIQCQHATSCSVGYCADGGTCTGPNAPYANSCP